MTIRNALILAAAMLLLSLGVTWAEKAGHIGEETSRRAVQVAAGLIAVYFANLVPKTLEPLSGRCDPSRVQALQRFGGWAIVLGGLGYSLAWLVAPIDLARPVSIALLGSAVVLVVARCAWTFATGARDRPSEP